MGTEPIDVSEIIDKIIADLKGKECVSNQARSEKCNACGKESSDVTQ